MPPLFPLNDDEIFYKNYYFASKDSAQLKNFLEKIDRKKILQHHLVVPDIFPEQISYNMEDSEYFKHEDKQSVF